MGTCVFTLWGSENKQSGTAPECRLGPTPLYSALSPSRVFADRDVNMAVRLQAWYTHLRQSDTSPVHCDFPRALVNKCFPVCHYKVTHQEKI